MAGTGKTSETKDFISFTIKLALIVFVVRSFIAAPFNIPSESMQPRLLIGDYLLVAKWPYGYSRYSLPFSLPLIPGRILPSAPTPGDVVVFKAPANLSEDWIKRVVALPGDMVQVRGGTLYLNGKAVPKKRIADLVIPVTPNMLDATRTAGGASPCYRAKYEVHSADDSLKCRYPQFHETLPNGRSYNVLDLEDGPEDNTEVMIVPQDHVFVMGDNRDRSADSRVPVANGGVGFLPQKNLVGRALVSVFATDGSANWLLPWTWFTAARTDHIGDGF
ncbi:signal peptidase I [Sphingobium sufflavum]|uniref:signal peptidase I n=1 Tax=Sphingobium sufflavum TaxID=1129547 RepID=UPI001F443A21|nr:signal peptidase I [Sphingobium sufflavum]MCE7797003.1 signal peptidase I [Sphingobium sufflavum]